LAADYFYPDIEMNVLDSIEMLQNFMLSDQNSKSPKINSTIIVELSISKKDFLRIGDYVNLKIENKSNFGVRVLCIKINTDGTIQPIENSIVIVSGKSHNINNFEIEISDLFVKSDYYGCIGFCLCVAAAPTDSIVTILKIFEVSL